MSSFIKKLLVSLSVLTAIIVSLITIYSFITQPEQPHIDVRFALSDSHKISIAPTISATNSETTNPFPLGIQITNHGEVEAKIYIFLL